MAEKLVMTVEEAGEALGIGRNLAYELVRQGRIPTIRMGARRLVVPVAALNKLLESAYKPETAGAR